MFNENTKKCSHIKTNGQQCGSPALHDQDLCYFHDQQRRSAARCAESVIDFPFPEDADSIQSSIALVMRGIVAGTVDRKTAGLLLYALQIASTNLRQTSFARPSDENSESDFDVEEVIHEFRAQTRPRFPDTKTSASEQPENNPSTRLDTSLPAPAQHSAL